MAKVCRTSQELFESLRTLLGIPVELLVTSLHLELGTCGEPRLTLDVLVPETRETVRREFDIVERDDGREATEAPATEQGASLQGQGRG